jgi:acyl carrier protein
MDVQKTIYSIISQQLGIDISQLNSEIHFRSLPNVNSMKVLQIILEVERALDIELDDEVTFRVETIGQFESEVEHLYGRKCASTFRGT